MVGCLQSADYQLVVFSVVVKGPLLPLFMGEKP